MDSGEGLLLFDPPSTSKQEHDVVELRNDTVTAYHCSGGLGRSAIGAIPLARGFRVVTQTPSVVDIPGPTCREVKLAPLTPDPVLEIPN